MQGNGHTGNGVGVGTGVITGAGVGVGTGVGVGDGVGTGVGDGVGVGVGVGQGLTMIVAVMPILRESQEAVYVPGGNAMAVALGAGDTVQEFMMTVVAGEQVEV